MKLHLGCGLKIIPGYINLDVYDNNHPEITQCDIRDLSKFSDSSVDVIYASHVLEHIPRKFTFSTLLEWNRVLKKDGILRIAVPDWDATVRVYHETNNYENLLNWIYGGSENEFNVHYRQFTYIGLSTLLIESGFKRISKYDWRETDHSDIDDFSKAYYPHMDFENGIQMSLNLECVKHISLKS